MFFLFENYEPLLRVLKEEFPYEERDFGFKNTYWFYSGNNILVSIDVHKNRWTYFAYHRFYKSVCCSDNSFFATHEFSSHRKYILPNKRHPWNAASLIQKAWRRHRKRIESATKIQRAWLEYHYRPGGRGYEIVKSRFEDRRA